MIKTAIYEIVKLVNEKGFSQILIPLVILVVLGLVGGAYYFGVYKNQQVSGSKTVTPLNNTTPLTNNTNKSKYTEQDGVVWNDVHEIVVSVNLYYAQTKKLPKNVEEVKSLSELSFFQIKNNPFTNKPYAYVPKSDGTGFVVSGTQSDGTEYVQDIPIN